MSAIAIVLFHPDELPQAITPATRRRIAEALGLVEPHPDW